MQLFFEIVDGDREGARFQIKPGLSIGRRNADILLRDSKVSGKHAIIESRGNDSLYLVDLGSANGLKVKNKKVAEVELTLGTRVQLGRTTLKVIDMDVAAIDLDAPVIETWPEIMSRIALVAKTKGAAEKREVAPFNPLVTLKILQGPQTGTEWTLGYGPRGVGSASLDLQLDDASYPEVCFELMPKRSGPVFRTDHPSIVKLNGRELREDEVSNGDIIEIANTRIQILFANE